MDKCNLVLDIDSVNFVAYLTVTAERLKSERTSDFIRRNVPELSLVEQLAPKDWVMHYRIVNNQYVTSVNENEITYTLDLLPIATVKVKQELEEALIRASKAEFENSAYKRSAAPETKQPSKWGFFATGVAIAATACVAGYLLGKE